MPHPPPFAVLAPSAAVPYHLAVPPSTCGEVILAPCPSYLENKPYNDYPVQFDFNSFCHLDLRLQVSSAEGAPPPPPLPHSPLPAIPAPAAAVSPHVALSPSAGGEVFSAPRQPFLDSKP